MTKNEKLFIEFLELNLNLIRVEKSIEKSILTSLKKLQLKLVDAIQQAGLYNFESDANKNIKLKLLFNKTNELIDRAYYDINLKLESESTNVAEVQVGALSKILLGLEILSVRNISRDEIKDIYTSTLLFGANVPVWWKRQSNTFVNKFQDVLRESVFQGLSLDNIFTRVLGTKALKFTDGIGNRFMNNGVSLVRSTLQLVGNEAKLRLIEANKNLFSNYVHMSILDSKTSDICIVRDGKEWDMEKNPIGHNLFFAIPPLHWNCRSSMFTPLKSGGSYYGGTRNINGKEFPASFTMKDYIDLKESQGEFEFLNDLLGVGRAEMYRSGKITLRQLLDFSGNPLTLKELKLKYN